MKLKRKMKTFTDRIEKMVDAYEKFFLSGEARR